MEMDTQPHTHTNVVFTCNATVEGGGYAVATPSSPWPGMRIGIPAGRHCHCSYRYVATCTTGSYYGSMRHSTPELPVVLSICILA